MKAQGIQSHKIHVRPKFLAPLIQDALENAAAAYIDWHCPDFPCFTTRYWQQRSSVPFLFFVDVVGRSGVMAGSQAAIVAP